MVLHLDCKREGEEEEPAPFVPAPIATPRAEKRLRPAVRSFEPEAPWTASPEPAFQIDGRDLGFLRSIGIDPTRRLRRKKS